ncbi:hypothetical protein MtrunA17_Chr8g0375691 [Medicago truncatula]|uniref:Uncharacterized protein n=1 Tax=Medicago truncatula TaxID=3880 RepID=A0A396GPJ5_MEDTR|nr:hypothetical protein MtrunA17_Chr8g0375691 [Medicago truncatula]
MIEFSFDNSLSMNEVEVKKIILDGHDVNEHSNLELWSNASFANS